MTDFYSELNIDKSKTLDEINSELVKLESTWKRREITNPEKATKMLALLIEAKKVFKDSASRADYDRTLINSLRAPQESSSYEARRQQLEKWAAEADSYFNNKEYDLAKSAIEKALSYMDPMTEDPKVYDLAALISRHNQEYAQALNYANKAIVLEPSVGKYYITKGVIISDRAVEENRHGRFQDGAALTRTAREAIQAGAGKARTAGDSYALGIALGVLAFSLYKHDPRNEAQAEQYAEEAERVGDSWGNAKVVLDEISAKREAARKAREEKLAEEERIKQKELDEKNRSIYNSAMGEMQRDTAESCKNALNMLMPIRGWKDVDQLIERLEERIVFLKAKSKVVTKRIIAVSIAAVIVLFAIIAASTIRKDIERHYIGNDVSWVFNQRTGTMVIRGTGAVQYARWEKERSEISEVKIEDGITMLQDSTFYGCSGVKKITCPATLNKVGQYTFLRCENLEKIIFAGTVSEWTKMASTCSMELPEQCKVTCSDGTYPQD